MHRISHKEADTFGPCVEHLARSFLIHQIDEELCKFHKQSMMAGLFLIELEPGALCLPCGTIA